MKTNFRRLQLISRVIDFNRLYVITIYGSEITLQGYATTQNINYFRQWFKIGYDDKFFSGTRGNIRLVLTLAD